MRFKIVTIYRDLSLFIFYMSNIVTLLALLAIAYSQTNISTLDPTWVTSPFFRAGYQTVISTMTGSGTQPQFTFTFSSSMVGIPSLAYGIKNYRGNDYFGQQFFQIRNIGLTPSTFSVEVQIYGITNIHILSIAYIAVEPNFPHHLNSFDNVPLNYSSGNIVNISIPTAAMVSFTEIIDYRTQTTGRMFTKFTGAISNYKIVLFITSLWIRGTWGSPVQIHIYPTILNQTHYQWIATAFTGLTITKLQFSEIIFNQKDVESSLKYFIVYEEWITDIDGGFREIPVEFVDNFIMAVTDFEAVETRCGFQYQWNFQINSLTGNHGIRILRSWTLTDTCGFSWARSSIFYMKTWNCGSPYSYFNLTTNLCQDMCHQNFIQNSVNLTCDCQYGYEFDGPNCTETCGDGTVFDQQCDDGNLIDGDGCSFNCTIQLYYQCFGGSNISQSTCREICGDGLLINDSCDDGNTINGDGCSDQCAIESGYQCSGGNLSSPSVCQSIAPPLFTLISFNKNTNKNAFTIELTIDNISPTILANIKAYLSFNFPYQSLKVSVDPDTKMITLDFTYNQSLNSDKPLIISYITPTGSSSSLTLPETTDNNLALKFYTQDMYQFYEIANKAMKSLSIVVLVCFMLLFLLVSKLIAIEMIFVFQFTYCGLIMLKKLEGLMEPYKNLWICNFYNDLYKASPLNLPPSINSIYYKSQFLANFNLDFLPLFLPLLVSIILITLSKLCNYRKLKINAQQALKEWSFSSILFCQFQFIYAFALFLKYGQQKTTGILLGLLIFTFLLFLVYLFIKYPRYFGEYKYFFKSKDSERMERMERMQQSRITHYETKQKGFESKERRTIQTIQAIQNMQQQNEQLYLFQQQFYSLVVLYRLALGFCMVGLSQKIDSLIITLLINVFWMLFLFYHTPYVKNFRPLSNSIVVVLISIFYLYARSVANSQNINASTYIPIAIFILLVYTFLLSLYCFIRHCFQLKQNKQLSELKIDNKTPVFEDSVTKRQQSQENIVDFQQFVNNEGKNQVSKENKQRQTKDLKKVKRTRKYKLQKQPQDKFQEQIKAYLQNN